MITYIKETKNERGFIKIVKLRIKRFFNMINRNNIDGKTIYYLPILKDKKPTKHRIIKLANKTSKLLEKDMSNIVVLSEYLSSIELLKSYLYSKNINILNGRILFKYLSKNIIEYILKLKKGKIENTEICVLVNEFTTINKKIIIEIAKSAKNTNIVTNNTSKCNKLEKYLYNEYGILLNNLNSKKTSLLKSKIILNLDFPEELINKYRINVKAIIINIQEKIEIQSKKFNGINVNYFEIDMPEKYKINGFKNEQIYESIIYNYNYEQALEKIKKDNIQIKNLIGSRGIISKQEFL